MRNRYPFLLISLLILPILIFAHSDEFGESDSFHFFHVGKLIFPVWTYWVEIIEHFAILAAVAIGLFLICSRSDISKNKDFNLIKLGFLLILISESFTLLHHFLIFPFGIFNAVFHHGLLFIGILLLVLGVVKTQHQTSY